MSRSGQSRVGGLFWGGRALAPGRRSDGTVAGNGRWRVHPEGGGGAGGGRLLLDWVGEQGGTKEGTDDGTSKRSPTVTYVGNSDLIWSPCGGGAILFEALKIGIGKDGYRGYCVKVRPG